MNYTKEQMTAIEHNKGPFMVLASPGSGKTAVITEHTRYLIEKLGVSPRDILVITFTKAAAVTMKERFDSMINDADVHVTFGTFHAVFFSILRSVYHYTVGNIIKDEQKLRIVRELCEKEGMELTTDIDYLNEILSEISYVKGEMMDLSAYYSSTCSKEVFERIYNGYESARKSLRLIDFDDMQKDCYELLNNRPDVLKAYQNRYKYILIDEFQDINRLQYNIVKMLALPENNLFIVGDDDQSIYHFRGAKPEIMLNFTNDYPDAKKVLLGVNYRSSSEIVEASKQLISNNKVRYPKEIESNMGGVEPIHLLKKENEMEQVLDIIEKVRDYNSKGIPYQDMAVIYRANIESNIMTERLMQYNIPFKTRDSINSVYEHWAVRSVIAYIRAALGDMSRANFLLIMNKPNRYLSRNLLEGANVDFDAMKEKLSDKPWMVERIDELIEDLEFIRESTPFAGINYIRRKIGYDSYILEHCLDKGIDSDDMLGVLDIVQDKSKDYKTYNEWFAYIREYKESLIKSRKDNEDKDAVLLTTMHKSKGLEFEVVFIVNAIEDHTPHKKAMKESDIEEERRMFYVAMTRAKRHLYIYSLDEFFSKKATVSRFVNELTFDRRQLAPGVLVQHKKFGKGVVTFADSDKVSIHFERDDESRTFKIDYAIGNGYLTVRTDA